MYYLNSVFDWPFYELHYQMHQMLDHPEWRLAKDKKTGEILPSRTDQTGPGASICPSTLHVVSPAELRELWIPSRTDLLLADTIEALKTNQAVTANLAKKNDETQKRRWQMQL
jgi:hypothetical protein